MTEILPSEGILKIKTVSNLVSLISQEILQKFPRLNFYKDENFLIDEEDGIVHIKIVDLQASAEANILKNGVEDIYSTYKRVFNSLNIDFNKLIFFKF